MSDLARCKNCGALIEWVSTTEGPDKRVPVEVKPVNAAIDVDGETVRVVAARVLHPRECSAKAPRRTRKQIPVTGGLLAASTPSPKAPSSGAVRETRGGPGDARPAAQGTVGARV